MSSITTKGTLICAFIALQIGDVITTTSALARHTGVEANPLMADLGSHWLLLKVVATIACVAIMIRCPERRSMLLAPWVALMAFVVVNNAMH